MGNRASVIFASRDKKNISPQIYLHWNGGPESIYAFLAEMNRRGCGQRSDNPEYHSARFCQIVGDFFDNEKHSATSLGLQSCPKSITEKSINGVANGDLNNGVYVITNTGPDTWSVRRFTDPTGQFGQLIEMPEKEVEAERLAAMQHKYNSGPDTIAKTFIELDQKAGIGIQDEYSQFA